MDVCQSSLLTKREAVHVQETYGNVSIPKDDRINYNRKVKFMKIEHSAIHVYDTHLLSIQHVCFLNSYVAIM